MTHMGNRACHALAGGRSAAARSRLIAERNDSVARVHDVRLDGRRAAGSTRVRRARSHADPSSEPINAPLDLPCQVHGPDLWFADDPADLELAKMLCADCPARPVCLVGATDRQEPFGVWGGQIFDRGRIVTFKRRRGRPRKDSAAPRHFPELPDPA